MGDRYKVVEGSQSAHCCFEATVIDTRRPTMIVGKQFVRKIGGVEVPQFDSICECFEESDAELICNALNQMSPRT
jgi:hypothetical protein